MKKSSLLILVIMLATCGIFFLTGCATSEQARGVKKSGFLGDYSQLQKGGGERALLYYVKPGVYWAGYDKVILDSVSIWYSENSEFEDVPQEELDNLAHYLYDAVKKQLEQNWTIVDKPGPGTIRLRMALTEAEGASREMDIATTYLPPARLISEGTKLATGTHAFVGETTIELEVLDSISNDRLLAIVDKRSGGKHYEGSTDNWADVKQACDWWAQKMSTELQKRRTE